MVIRSTSVMTGLFPRHCFRLMAIAVLCFTVSACRASPVIMISIDELKPEYRTHADEHSLRIATLRRFVREGVYADGVTPVTSYRDLPESHSIDHRRMAI